MIIGNKDRLAFDLLPVLPSWEARYPPEAAAWAGLSIWIDGHNVCEHVARGTDRVEPRVYVPLGPIADWLIRSWQAIQYEERPSRFPMSGDPRATLQRWFASPPSHGLSNEDWYEQCRSWWERHFVEAGSSGAVLPDLAFVRQIDQLVVAWSQVAPAGSPQGRGCTLVPWAEASHVLGDFVASVAEAFRSRGCETAFPWVPQQRPLEHASSSPEFALELYTGHSAASIRESLGAPSNQELSDLLRTSVSDPATSILSQVLRDMPPRLDVAAVLTAREIQDMVAGVHGGARLAQMRHDVRETTQGVGDPEDHGHEAAAAVRDLLHLGGTPAPKDWGKYSAVVTSCGLELLADQPGAAPLGQIHGLLGAMVGRGAAIALLPSARMSYPWARRFELARLLGNAILDSYRGDALGRASSQWGADFVRRRSGAFAAEFLLPESALVQRGLAHTDSAAQGTVFEDLMHDFGIGARAAAYQLWNLRLLSSEELRDELIETYAATHG